MSRGPLSSEHKAKIIATAAENARKLRDYERLQAMVDKLLNHCPDMECSECARICCPHGDPMHFHHDGCPSCATYRVVCARCGKTGLTDEFIPEEGDAWECPPCNERCNEQDRQLALNG